MDISAEKCETRDNSRPDFFSTVRQAVSGIIRRLVEFFTVTEADRTKAGIYIRRDGA
ncbi:MAG: hypothetical protein WBM17_00530 [Anaerolineales bacterium]